MNLAVLNSIKECSYFKLLLNQPDDMNSYIREAQEFLATDAKDLIPSSMKNFGTIITFIYDHCRHISIPMDFMENTYTNTNNEKETVPFLKDEQTSLDLEKSISREGCTLETKNCIYILSGRNKPPYKIQIMNCIYKLKEVFYKRKSVAVKKIEKADDINEISNARFNGFKYELAEVIIKKNSNPKPPSQKRTLLTDSDDIPSIMENECIKDKIIGTRADVAKFIFDLCVKECRPLHPNKSGPYLRFHCTVCDGENKCPGSVNFKEEITENGEVLYKIKSFKEHKCSIGIVKPPKEVLQEKVKDQIKDPKKDMLTDSKIDTIKSSLQNSEISTRTLYRISSEICDKNRVNRKMSWAKIPSLLKEIETNGGRTNICLKPLDEESSAIESFGLIPPYAIRFIKSDAFPGVAATDGSFLNSISLGTLYILGCKTGTGKDLPLAIQYSNSNENKSGYLKMLNMFTTEELNLFEAIAADGGTHVQSALKELLPGKIIDCYKHLKDKLSSEAKNLLYKVVYAESREEAVEAYELCKKNSEFIKDRLRKVQTMSRYPLFEGHNVLPNFGNVTSNIAEQINSMYKNRASQEPFDVIRRLLEYGECVIGEFQNLQGSFTKKAIDIFSVESDENVLKSVLCSGSNGTYNCTGTKSVFKVTVSNDEVKCECPKYRDTKIPCRHIIKALKAAKIPGASRFIGSCYKVHVLKSIEVPKPIDYDKLEIRNEYRSPKEIGDLRTFRKRFKSAREINEKV